MSSNAYLRGTHASSPSILQNEVLFDARITEFDYVRITCKYHWIFALNHRSNFSNGHISKCSVINTVPFKISRFYNTSPKSWYIWRTISKQGMLLLGNRIHNCQSDIVCFEVSLRGLLHNMSILGHPPISFIVNRNEYTVHQNLFIG